MSRIRRFDHVGITVANLDTVTAFFVGLGLEVEGTRMFVEGEFLDTVIGIPDSRTEIVMLRPPDGGTRLELSSFVRPDHEPGSPAAMANKLGLRNVAFEVEDLQAAIDRLAADGGTLRLLGGTGRADDGDESPEHESDPAMGAAGYVLALAHARGLTVIREE